MRVWTKQHENVLKMLLEDGRYTAKKEFAAGDLEDQAYLMREAYDWLTKNGPMAKERPEDADLKGLQEATSNVYGNGHTSLYADVMDAIRNHRKPYVDAVAGTLPETAPPALACVVHYEPGYLAQALEAVDGRPAGTCELSPCRTLESSLNLARDKGAEMVLVYDKDGERTVRV